MSNTNRDAFRLTLDPPNGPRKGLSALLVPKPSPCSSQRHQGAAHQSNLRCQARAGTQQTARVNEKGPSARLWGGGTPSPQRP